MVRGGEGTFFRRAFMANQIVKWEVKDGIGTVSLNRPEKRNAINGEVLEGINKAFTELSLSAETKVILLQGVGPAFSAGIDFKYLAATTQDDRRAPGIGIREGIDAIQSIFNRIERIEKPVVANM